MVEKTQTEAHVKLSAKEIEEAKKDGALDYIKDGSKHAMASDTGTPSYEAVGEVERFRVAPGFESTFLAPALDASVGDLEKRLKDDKDPLGFEDAKGLLALERSGKNRTGYVKMLMKFIGVKSPYDVTDAGPPYTNDETAITEL